MKKFSLFLLPFMAGAVMASCSKDDAGSSFDQNTDGLDGAYVSIAISSPSTRGDIPDVDGTAEESTVGAVKLLIFDKEYNYLGLGKQEGTAASNIYDFEVAPDAYRFFAIVNTNDAIDAALSNISGNWNTVSSALQTVLTLDSRNDIGAYIQDNAFVMVNEGTYTDNKESVLARPIDSQLVKGKLSTDKTKPSKLYINVDRVVAKFTAMVDPNLKVTDERTDKSDPLAVQSPAPEGSVEGVRLNVVNRKSFIYSHINHVNAQGDDYRTDPNMSVLGEEAQAPGVETSLTKNFFWLHNYEDTNFYAPDAANGYSEYVFENTAIGGEFFNYNNLTQLMVKAIYVPTGRTKPASLPGDGFTTELDHKTEDLKSWFAINIEGYGTMQMTFTGVKQFYTMNKVGDTAHGVAQDLVICGKMDIQLRHMLASAENLNGITEAELSTICWDDSRVTCEVLNSIPKGGYVAATVDKEENYIVQFYQFGLNYYDIFIQQDSNEDIGHLGRWGMVRNNHYTLTVKSISGPGLPYIPDPTDPEIKDPQNPDPKDPEPADKGMAYIEAHIEVNPWTMWTQDVDLN